MLVPYKSARARCNIASPPLLLPRSETNLDWLARLIILSWAVLILGGWPERGITQEQEASSTETSDVVAAVVEKNVVQLSQLLDAGSNPNAIDDNGQTVLDLAVTSRAYDVAAVLISRGAKVPPLSTDQMDALLLSASSLNGDAALIMHKLGADINATDINKWTPLHVAVASGNRILAASYIELGANINARTNEGLTPLLLATTQGDYFLVAILLDKGADPNIKSGGYSPLDIAELTASAELLALLIDKTAPPAEEVVQQAQAALKTKELYSDPIDGKLSEATKAAVTQFQINSQLPAHGYLSRATLAKLDIGNDPQLNIDLVVAARNGELALVERLVQEGAYINIADRQGWTPLMHAVFSGHVEAAKGILDLGGLVNAAAKDGTTAGFLAAVTTKLTGDQKPNMLNLLRERGADFNAKRQDGLSAAAIASVEGGVVAQALGNQGSATAKKLWIAILSKPKHGSSSDQSVEISASFPGAHIEEHWKNGKIVDEIQYADGEWVIVTAKPSSTRTQKYLFVPTWPTKQTQKYEKQGFKITSVVHDGTQYLLMLTKSADSKDMKWAQSQPKELGGIRKQKVFGKNYHLVATIPGKDSWVVGASSKTGFTNQEPPYLSKQFPGEYIREKWAAGYDITGLTYGLATWSVIMSKGTGIKEQTWVTGEAFPAKEIADMQAKGFRVDLISKG